MGMFRELVDTVKVPIPYPAASSADKPESQNSSSKNNDLSESFGQTLTLMMRQMDPSTRLQFYNTSVNAATSILGQK
jgi:hypothetical protein